MGKNKYTFLESRLIFQNQEVGPQSSYTDDASIMPDEENEFYDLQKEAIKNKDLLTDIGSLTENEATDAYNKLQAISNNIKSLRGRIEDNKEIVIDVKNTLLKKLDELTLYLNEQLLPALKESRRGKAEIIEDLLGDKYLDEDGNPTSEWFNIFNVLDKKDQANLLDELPTEMREEVWLRRNSI